MHFIKLDFPEPLLPVKPIISPSATEKLTSTNASIILPCKICMVKDLLRFTISKIGCIL